MPADAEPASQGRGGACGCGACGCGCCSRAAAASERQGRRQRRRRPLMIVCQTRPQLCQLSLQREADDTWGVQGSAAVTLEAQPARAEAASGAGGDARRHVRACAACSEATPRSCRDPAASAATHAGRRMQQLVSGKSIPSSSSCSIPPHVCPASTPHMCAAAALTPCFPLPGRKRKRPPYLRDMQPCCCSAAETRACMRDCARTPTLLLRHAVLPKALAEVDHFTGLGLGLERLLERCTHHVGAQVGVPGRRGERGGRRRGEAWRGARGGGGGGAAAAAVAQLPGVGCFQAGWKV